MLLFWKFSRNKFFFPIVQVLVLLKSNINTLLSTWKGGQFWIILQGTQRTGSAGERSEFHYWSHHYVTLGTTRNLLSLTSVTEPEENSSSKIWLKSGLCKTENDTSWAFNIHGQSAIKQSYDLRSIFVPVFEFGYNVPRLLYFCYISKPAFAYTSGTWKK